MLGRVRIFRSVDGSAITMTSGFVSQKDSSHRLRQIAKQAVKDFASTCFWNVRLSDDLLDDLPIIFERLRKYGGLKGWRIAADIESLAGKEAVRWR